MTLLLKKFWWVLVIIAAIGAFAKLLDDLEKAKNENDRISENFKNVSWNLEGAIKNLNLTREEYRLFKDQAKTKTDSVLKANDLLNKKVRSTEVINTAYKDTSKANVTHGQPIAIATSDTLKNDIRTKYQIEVEVKEYCWGMKGIITTTDPESKLMVTERTANNSIQKLEISNRFLGFLWPTKKSKFVAFTDCGTVYITNINFVK